MHAAQPVPRADSGNPLLPDSPGPVQPSLLLWLCLLARVYQFISHSRSVYLSFP